MNPSEAVGGKSDRNKRMDVKNKGQMVYMTDQTQIPVYLPYPRFLLGMDLTQTAKVLYALLLDRASLSRKTGWKDVKENSGSMLSFENEQEEAKRILHQQKELIDQLIQINQEMKAMINKSENDIDLNEIQALKKQFNASFEQQQEEQNRLQMIYEKLFSAYEVEKQMLRTYFLNETDQIIDMLTSTVERQDSEVSQLSQELIHELRSLEETEVEANTGAEENEPTENVAEMSESL